MKLPRALIEELSVRPGHSAHLDQRLTTRTHTEWLGHLGVAHPKEMADRDLDRFKAELASAQELLFAADRWSLLIVLQALDAAGKDGTIKHVMSGVNPQGCDVHGFRAPSTLELRHDFLWRCYNALPERGRIGIFNRSYYEEVLVVRVHPDLLAAQHLPPGSTPSDGLWKERFEDINAFERHLDRAGTKIVKFFLHVSKDEQRRRLLERLDDPSKQWKFSPQDVAEHARFDDYQRAYEEALTATSTPWAPWYVIPADHKHAMRALVGGIVVDTIERLDLSVPTLDPTRTSALEEAGATLRAEDASAAS